MSNEPEPNPEDDADFAAAEDRELIRPKWRFKDKDLLPYSRGTRLLYGTVIDDNDVVAYRNLAFVYLHLHPRDEMIPLAWNLNAFRAAVLEWSESLSDADMVEAGRLKEEMLQSDIQTAVEPKRTGTEKKSVSS
jgi:hypothetical protein